MKWTKDHRQTVVTLKPRDLLVLYTDGITEAENEAGQDLGREQLLEWARQGPATPRRRWEKACCSNCRRSGGLRNDEETLLVLQRDEEYSP